MQMAKVRARIRSGRTELGWLFALTALVFMTLVLSACNTARGVGEDVSAAGDVITEPFEDDDEDASPSG
jgi:predicted small secreted protein